MGRSKSTGASAARSAAPASYGGDLEDKIVKILDDASRTRAVFKVPGRMPVSRMTARRCKRKQSKFDACLVKRVVVRIQTRIINKLRSANSSLGEKEAREMLPRFDSAWVKKNAPLIEHVAVLQMRDEVRRMAEHRNTRLSEQPASADRADSDLKGKRVIICSTEADLKNKELVLAGSRMASYEYVEPPTRAKFLGTMRKFMAEHEARKGASVQKEAAQRSLGARREVEREMEVV